MMQWGTLSDKCHPVGDGEGEEDLCHVHSIGRTVTHGPCVGWGRRRSQLCTQWGMLTDTCSFWGMGEERRISAMYTVEDDQ